MNILFLTLVNITNIDNHGIYEDLLREFVRNNHRVFVVSPAERKLQEHTHIIQHADATILRVKTGNIQKTNLIEKGVSTILLETQFIKAIKKYYAKTRFDLVLYSTPPVTLAKVIAYVKKRDGAKSYLLLKDIFPQNAVDIGLLSKTGAKGMVYKYFRNKEKKLYELSDRIGCMSLANVQYVLEHNPEINPKKIEICPNCISPVSLSLHPEERGAIRRKYGIPQARKVFVYGGNLGKPQGIPFLIDCLRSQKNNQGVFFLIVGDGTEYGQLDAFTRSETLENVKLISRLPKDDYDKIVAACDVGLIFLDHRFTIPNFPSRLLSYMQAGLPVLACTDHNTDIGKTIVDGGFGWWCESNDTAGFENIVRFIQRNDYSEMKDKSLQYLNSHYTVKKGYQIICENL